MPGPLTFDALKAAAKDGSIDTVLVCLIDMQGRLMGKRIHGEYFLDEVLSHGTEGCNYLLAVDVDRSRPFEHQPPEFSQCRRGQETRRQR